MNNIDLGSLSEGIVSFGNGSIEAAPNLGTGSDALDFAPYFPGNLIKTIGQYLGAFGL